MPVISDAAFDSAHKAVLFFFFNDTATTEIYTLSLHDALPIFHDRHRGIASRSRAGSPPPGRERGSRWADRKSTRLNSSHDQISYAVFCLKKKKKPRQYLWFATFFHMRPGLLAPTRPGYVQNSF